MWEWVAFYVGLVLFVALNVGVLVVPIPALAPLSAIIVRWVRWLTFSAMSALLLKLFVFEDRPAWVLMGVSFLGWWLLESVYSWVAIDVLSKSQVPLFPKFRRSEAGAGWPNQRRFIAIREWLRRQGFTRKESLLAVIQGDLALRSAVYENPEGTIRLQVLFIPQPAGRIVPVFVFSSRFEEERRLVTDNFHLPFGGFYPEEWLVERRPLTRSPADMLRRHHERIEAYGQLPLRWEAEVLDDLTWQQRRLEQLNVELGFLNRPEQQEQYGRITREGRFRIWAEWWSLAYLGTARSY